MSQALLIVLFLVCAVGGTGLLAYAVRAGHRSRAALKAMAEAEGWQVRTGPSPSGYGTETVISDPSEGWSLTLTFLSSNTSSSTNRWTSFDAPDLPIEGLAVLGPDLPEKTKEMAGKMMGLFGGDLGLMLLNKITGGMGEEARGLRSVDSPGPGTLLSTPGAETALNDLRFAPELTNARLSKNEAQQPIVMRGEFGLRIRTTRYLKKPEDAKDFIDLGRALADNLRS